MESNTSIPKPGSDFLVSVEPCYNLLSYLYFRQFFVQVHLLPVVWYCNKLQTKSTIALQQYLNSDYCTAMIDRAIQADIRIAIDLN